MGFIDSYRSCLRGLFAALALTSAACSPSVVRSQVNPLPPGQVRIVVGLTAGGPLDVVARLLAYRLADKIKRSVVVVNLPGSGGNLAAANVANSPADGLSLLASLDTVFTVNPYLYPTLGFKPEELAPLAITGEFDLMLGLHPNVPANTFGDLIKFAEDNPVSFASGGEGSPGHLAFAYMRMTTGITARHVPFPGAAPAITDLLAGRVQAAFIVSSAMQEHVLSGKIKPVAVSSGFRLKALPGVPTAKEAGIGDFEAVFAFLMLAPSAIPVKLRNYLSDVIVSSFQDNCLKAQLSVAGITHVAKSADQARAWIEQERARWSKVVSAAKLQAD